MLTPRQWLVLLPVIAAVAVALRHWSGMQDFVRQGIYLEISPRTSAGDDGQSSSNTPYTEEAMADRITSLPGLWYNPGFNMFSGYLTVSKENGRNIFYWFVESLGDPATDPVVFWTNGGPGCSGLIGFGMEHGPFRISKDGTLRPSRGSWNGVASILYVEQPAGVGFSYSETPEDLHDVGDEAAAADNLVLIHKFFERFPERKTNNFYIASESYGGHYVPQLAKKLVDDIANNVHAINFRGFLVGNPFVDPFTNEIAQTKDFYQHGLISRPMFEHWLSKCSVRESYDRKHCLKGTRKMRKNMKDINPYALDYPVCTEEKVDVTHATSSQVMTFLNRTARPDLFPQNLGPPFLPPDVKYLPCEEQHTRQYLNNEDVQKALHVRGVLQHWRECAPDEELSYSYIDYLNPQIDLYREIIDVAKSGHLHLRMLIYSGDNDSICSTSSTQAWIYDLGVKPVPGKDWNEWTLNHQTAGFLTHFDLGEHTKSKFIFATVHGAGHEVPAYRPMEALALFTNFLNDEL